MNIVQKGLNKRKVRIVIFKKRPILSRVCYNRQSCKVCTISIRFSNKGNHNENCFKGKKRKRSGKKKKKKRKSNNGELRGNHKMKSRLKEKLQ